MCFKSRAKVAGIERTGAEAEIRPIIASVGTAEVSTIGPYQRELKEIKIGHFACGDMNDVVPRNVRDPARQKGLFGHKCQGFQDSEAST